MNDDLTQQTLEQIKAANGGQIAKATTVTTASGLVEYDLQRPGKNLYPVNTPIINSLPRVGGSGTATHWNAITGITGSGVDSMGWVPEGQRAGAMQITVVPKLAAYQTIGEEESVTYEAIHAAQNYEDILASSATRLLQKLKLKEESGVIGGNNGLALGTTTTPTLGTAVNAAATINATESVIVVAMTYEGYRGWVGAGSSIVSGITQTKVVTGQDGKNFVLNCGYAQKSANATQAVTTGNNLTASIAPMNGAVAYAWYVGTAGSERLEKVTTTSATTFATLAGTGQLASALAATDNSKNGIAYDGLLYTAWGSGSGAYVNMLAAGTPGTGTTLTASGHGGVAEIDAMLQSMWDGYQVSPSVIYVHSQQLKDITTKTLSGGSNAPLVRYVMDNNQKNLVQANQVVASYYNPYTSDGGAIIPVKLHPALVAGTMMAWANDLPAQYQSPDVPNVAEIKARKDYYMIDWPIVTRESQKGVYSEQVLTVYAPFAVGLIGNIAAG